MSRRSGPRHACASLLVVFTLTLLATPVATPNPNDNPCDPGEAPDVIVSNIYETRRWGRVGDITAFSVGTYSCNMGDCWLNWIAETNEHPVISGNIYRLMDGRFEQIGQTWLKHGFYALSGDLCGGGCIPTDGNHLGVLCSDPYSAPLNGEQDRLGPKFEVNPYTGVFPYPATDLYLEGDAIYKRLQVHNDDLNPVLNPGAKYFVDSQYVTADDAAAGMQNNNSSHRPVNVTGSEPTYNLSLSGTTQQEIPVIYAWVNEDSEVMLSVVDVPNDGVLFVASKVTQAVGGMYHYEYAVQNLNSHRGTREFRIPILPNTNVVNIGFHDVEYHSGEPQDGTDWPGVVVELDVPHEVVWNTSTYETNPDANALLWDTLYNFRFDAELPPVLGEVQLGLFRPGFPSSMTTRAYVPARCNENGSCDLGEDVCECVNDCVPAVAESFCTDGLDDDCDGLVDCQDADCCVGTECDDVDGDSDTVGICYDCNDRDPGAWYPPTDVRNVIFKRVFNQIALWWSSPADPGAASVTYEILRTEDPSDFTHGATCLYPASSAVTYYFDTEEPDPGAAYCYLVRAQNNCPYGEGGVGSNSQGEPRPAATCP